MPDRLWPGLDPDFLSQVKDVEASSAGQEFLDSLGESWIFSSGKMLPLASPIQVAASHGPSLLQFVSIYQRAIQDVVHAYSTSPDVREVISTPAELVDDVDASADPDLDAVHLCRVDLLLDGDGGYHAIETNANCPGGLLFTGMASRAWRAFLTPQGYEPPPPLEHEQQDWMAGWFLDVAEGATGDRPDFVAVVRHDGGNRLELPHLIREFKAHGVESVECDPEEITIAPNGDAMLHGRVVRYAYQKLGMQAFLKRRAELDDYVQAVRTKRLFVQNGQRGRWIGDSKLCLAILSDPAFRSMFSDEVAAVLEERVPWSRNVALLDSAEQDRIRRQRGDYVLKRPLDTRGRGVVIGCEADDDEWSAALDTALEEKWLVQAFHLTTPMPLGDDDGRHDLAIGAINGRPVGAFSRTSSELRVNVARSGEVHPAFISS